MEVRDDEQSLHENTDQTDISHIYENLQQLTPEKNHHEKIDPINHIHGIIKTSTSGELELFHISNAKVMDTRELNNGQSVLLVEVLWEFGNHF